MSLAVVFERGDVTRTLVVFDDDTRGEGRAALVDAALARMLLTDEVAYLVAVDDALGFLEAAARPVPVVRVVFYPATVGGACDACEGFLSPPTAKAGGILTFRGLHSHARRRYCVLAPPWVRG